MIIIVLIFILYNILMLFNIKKNSNLFCDTENVICEIICSLIIGTGCGTLIWIFNNFKFNKYILILSFSSYLIFFIICVISDKKYYKKEILLHYLSYFIFMNLIYKNYYLDSYKLDFTTRIDDIKITNPEALEYLSIINNKLIPAYLDIKKMIKKLYYTEDSDQTINELLSKENNIKAKIINNVDNIINIINKKELNQINKKLNKIDRTIDSL